jgi:hypothetical protein
MITRALLGAKIEEFPKDFHATVEVDGYEVMIITEQRPSVAVSKKRGPGRGPHIVICDPNAAYGGCGAERCRIAEYTRLRLLLLCKMRCAE